MAFVEQEETTHLDSNRSEYPQRFNLLDMLGVSRDLSPVNPRPDKSGPPEQDNYGKPMFNWDLFASGKAQKRTRISLSSSPNADIAGTACRGCGDSY
jgi:hypothetical protein